MSIFIMSSKGVIMVKTILAFYSKTVVDQKSVGTLKLWPVL